MLASGMPKTQATIAIQARSPCNVKCAGKQGLPTFWGHINAGSEAPTTKLLISGNPKDTIGSKCCDKVPRSPATTSCTTPPNISMPACGDASMPKDLCVRCFLWMELVRPLCPPSVQLLDVAVALPRARAPLRRPQPDFETLRNTAIPPNTARPAPNGGNGSNGNNEDQPSFNFQPLLWHASSHNALRISNAVQNVRNRALISTVLHGMAATSFRRRPLF